MLIFEGPVKKKTLPLFLPRPRMFPATDPKINPGLILGGGAIAQGAGRMWGQGEEQGHKVA